MSRIIKFFTKIVPTEAPPQLGRWTIEVCQKKVHNKIDSSNEDHCGPCGQYGKQSNRTVKAINTMALKKPVTNYIEYE